MTSPLSQSPVPARPKNEVTFTLDTDGLTLPITFSGTWDPNGPTFEHTVTSDMDASWTETAPSDAQGGMITSPTVPDFPIVVSP